MAPKGIGRIIDGDGHVIEDMQAIIKYLPAEWQNNNTTRILGVFPGLDHMHNFIARNPPGAFVSQGAEGWSKFADQLGLEAAVLYPTAGLAYGKMIGIEYAIGAAQAYNAFVPHDPRGELIRLRDGESVSEYLVRQIKAGRVFVGVEGDEPALGWAVRKYGNEAFVFSSDYPHEVNLDTCQHEIEELLENDDLSKDDKDAIFSRNSERFYGLGAAYSASKPGAPQPARDAAAARV